MKENVLDVLMYLFETYVDTDEEPEADHNELRDELSRAGFGDPEIDRALDWLDGLTEHQDSLAFNAQTAHGTRIYNDFEQERLFGGTLNLDEGCVAALGGEQGVGRAGDHRMIPGEKREFLPGQGRVPVECNRHALFG